ESLRNAILRKRKVLRKKAGYIIALIVRHSDIQLDQIHDHSNSRRVFLSCRPTSGEGGKNYTEPKKWGITFSHGVLFNRPRLRRLANQDSFYSSTVFRVAKWHYSWATRKFCLDETHHLFLAMHEASLASLRTRCRKSSRP